MQKYICNHCDDLECDSSICPVCGSRTIPTKSTIFWCEKCKAPSYENACDCCGSSCIPIATDLRPVFPEERLLIEAILDEPMKYKDCSWYSSGGGTYFVDGKKVRIPQKEAMSRDVQDIIKK